MGSIWWRCGKHLQPAHSPKGEKHTIRYLSSEYFSLCVSFFVKLYSNRIKVFATCQWDRISINHCSSSSWLTMVFSQLYWNCICRGSFFFFKLDHILFVAKCHKLKLWTFTPHLRLWFRMEVKHLLCDWGNTHLRSVSCFKYVCNLHGLTNYISKLCEVPVHMLLWKTSCDRNCNSCTSSDDKLALLPREPKTFSSTQTVGFFSE